jgi:hypothetical protein
MQRELQLVGCKTKKHFDEECVRRGGRTILATGHGKDLT